MESGKANNFEASSDEENDRPEKSNDSGSGVGRSYDCTFCKRGFTNAQALGGHMNIHRKDKAKAKQNTKQSSPFTSKSSINEVSRYFSTTSSDQQHHYYGGVGAQFHYQNYFPPSSYNPSNQHAYHEYNFQAPRHQQPSPPEDHHHDGDVALGLNLGTSHVEFDEGRNKNDHEDDGEVDLELRLGHNR